VTQWGFSTGLLHPSDEWGGLIGGYETEEGEGSKGCQGSEGRGMKRDQEGEVCEGPECEGQVLEGYAGWEWREGLKWEGQALEGNRGQEGSTG
jgi:hypothetical protein